MPPTLTSEQHGSDRLILPLRARARPEGGIKRLQTNLKAAKLRLNKGREARHKAKLSLAQARD